MILSMVNALGTNYIASRTYLMLVATFVMTFSISLGQGTAIQVGQLVGAHEPEEAYKKCFKSLKLSIVLAFVVTSIVVIFKRNIMGIFYKRSCNTGDIFKSIPFDDNTGSRESIQYCYNQLSSRCWRYKVPYVHGNNIYFYCCRPFLIYTGNKIRMGTCWNLDSQCC